MILLNLFPFASFFSLFQLKNVEYNEKSIAQERPQGTRRKSCLPQDAITMRALQQHHHPDGYLAPQTEG